MRVTRPPLTTPSRKLLALLISATLPSLSNAQESSPRLEEVIVTAQKRTESLQRVPLSVAAVNGSKLEESGIENIDDLTVLVPNIHFTETGFSTQVRLRGIGSDNSQGFEQSVGTYVDGIYYGRAQLFRAPLMDMERIEVLRGPQSTLFGKNSIAGALNLTTAKPSDEFEAMLKASHEFQHNQNEINGVLSIPVSENFGARLAIRNYTEDGYFKNSYKNTDEPNTEETTVRLSLEWQATDALNLFLKGERNEFLTKGRPIEITYDAPREGGTFRYSDSLAGLHFAIPTIEEQPALEANQDYTRQIDNSEISDNEISNFTFIADYALGDYTLTAVSGLLDFSYDEVCDCDYTASEMINLNLGETYEQFSQEIRISSPTDASVDWIAGLFYQTWDQSYADELTIEGPDANILPALNPSLAVLSNTGLRRDFTQSSDSSALFARATWHLADRWHLTLGARYTTEEKHATKVLNNIAADTGDILDLPFPFTPLTAQIYLNAFLAETEQNTLEFSPGVVPEPLSWNGHNVEKSRKENAFNPLINIEFDLNDDIMTYVSYTTGFKAGGFDPRSNSVGNFTTATVDIGANETEDNPYRHFEFEEESVVAYEFGLKSSLADGRGEVNVAIFRMDYEDLQVSQFDGAVGFNVGNAKETQVQGIELDGRWALADGLTASYGLSYLDFEYIDFQNGNCYTDQVPDGIVIDGIQYCDYSGKRGVYTPEYTTNLSLDYRRELFNGIQWISFIDVQYVDGHDVHVNLDPQGKIEAHTNVNMRIGLDAERWSIGLLGKNLLDEYVISYTGDAPLSASNFNAKTFYSVVKRPMTIALEGAIKF